MLSFLHVRWLKVCLLCLIKHLPSLALHKIHHLWKESFCGKNIFTFKKTHLDKHMLAFLSNWTEIAVLIHVFLCSLKTCYPVNALLICVLNRPFISLWGQQNAVNVVLFFFWPLIIYESVSVQSQLTVWFALKVRNITIRWMCFSVVHVLIH